MNHTINFILILAGVFFGSATIYAQQKLLRQTISASGGSYISDFNGKSLLLQQSIGQASSIGEFSSNKIVVRQGFIQSSIYRNSIVNSTELEVSIYPNPFNQNIYIDFKDAQHTPVDIKIFDISGRTVFNQTFQTTDSEKIELRHLELASGSYAIWITAENKSFSSILIKP